MRFFSPTICILACACLLVAGCGKVEAPLPKPLSEAHKDFVKIAKEEYGTAVVLKPLERTLWVYVPLKGGMYDIVAGDGPVKQPHAVNTHTINYLDGQVKNANFVIQYDIAPVKKYTVSPGYTFAPTEEFKTVQRNIVSALGQAYEDVERLPQNENIIVKRVDGDLDFKHPDKQAKHKKLVHSYVKTEKAPDFVVLVFADTTKGMESRMIMAFSDYHRARFDASFMEEYHKRFIVEQPAGNRKIIGDETGDYLELKDLSWAEFLLKQILYRIDFQFKRSDFPPSGPVDDIVASTAALVFQHYGFDDYSTLHLHDLNKQVTHSLSKEDVRKKLKY